MRNLLVTLAAFLSVGLGSLAYAQPETQSASTTQTPQPALSAPNPQEPQWFIGLLGRVNWIPPFIPQLFLDDSPAVVGPGFEILATKRNNSGMSVVFGLGYTSYAFKGPSRDKGDPETDTEYMDSSLGLIHASGSLLWSTDLVAKQLAIEYGFGLDFGVVIGKLVRTEAYRDSLSGVWKPCVRPLTPNPVYCEYPVNGRESDAYNQEGAHYHVTEKRIPPVMAFPHIPHLALRYAPHPKVALKLELAYGIVQFWCGLSAHYGFN
jgi:hypothetical protein